MKLPPESYVFELPNIIAIINIIIIIFTLWIDAWCSELDQKKNAFSAKQQKLVGNFF